MMNNSIKPSAKRCPFKLEILLELLITKGKSGLNSPEANYECGDTCLHTTVSTVHNKHGINIFRKSEQWTHRNGGKTHFCRYWIDESQHPRAIEVINFYRAKRGLSPIKSIHEIRHERLSA